MARLEDLTKGTLARGVLADRPVKVVDVEWFGSNAITLTYTDETTGKPGQELLYCDDQARLTIEQAGRAWSMDADGAFEGAEAQLIDVSQAIEARFMPRKRSNGSGSWPRTLMPPARSSRLLNRRSMRTSPPCLIRRSGLGSRA